jgi:effector-binding domain-containing protein
VKRVGFIVLILFAAFVVIGYSLPKQVHVERSILIERPISMIFTILNGYQYAHNWSPWMDRDPDAEFVISGPESGVGARLSWIGDPQLVGSGWQEIVAFQPYSQIDIKLDFDSQGVADTGFTLKEQGSATLLSWTFDTDLTAEQNFLNAFLARYFGLLFDRWIGGDYEQGLANLKQYAESLAISEFKQLEIVRMDVSAQDILYVSTSSSQNPEDIAIAMATAYAEISEFVNNVGIHINGQPMAISLAREDGSYRFDAAIPVDIIPAELSGNVKAGTSPSGPAVRALHRGAYEQLMPTY